MSSPLLESLATAWPATLWQDVPVLVGVSGGADSVAILRGLCQARPRSARGSLTVAHFDHGWRAESGEDAVFVANLAKTLDLPLFSEKAKAPQPPAEAATPVPSPAEAAARDARYAFFKRAANQIGARYLVLAHTLDDDAETILHRILRGTGLRGLAGIPFARPLTEMTTVVRPLLTVTRDAVLEYLASIQQPWREDRSNASLVYARNRIRHELLPILEQQFNRNVRDALLRLGEHARDAQLAVESSAHEIWDVAVSRRNPDDLSSADIHVDPMRPAGSVVVTELLRMLWRESQWNEQAMTARCWRRLYQAISSDTECVFELPGPVRVERRGRWLFLERAV